MRTKNEIERELRAVRKRLSEIRAAGSEDTDTLYGAQQALGWVLGELSSPTQLELLIEQVLLDTLSRRSDAA